MGMNLLKKYFDLSEQQIGLFEKFEKIFIEKNAMVNLVSRKDEENLEERHFLHSLGIAKHFDLSGARVLDVGTGGGFPGLPLAIVFPEGKFHLIDARRKKIDAVNDFIQQLGLENVKATHIRAEELTEQCDFVVSRAVTSLDRFTRWTERVIRPGAIKGQQRGIIYLRGLDFDFNSVNDEISPKFDCNRIVHLEKDFELDFFSSKKVVFLQRL